MSLLKRDSIFFLIVFFKVFIVKYVALICARGGSKGLPNKNIKPLGGIPLIGLAIKTAQQVGRLSKI